MESNRDDPPDGVVMGRWDYMTLSFLSKRRLTADCTHSNQMRIEIAGMSREVCEACGKVTVSYVEEHYDPERVQEVAARSFGSADVSDD